MVLRRLPASIKSRHKQRSLVAAQCLRIQWLELARPVQVFRVPGQVGFDHRPLHFPFHLGQWGLPLAAQDARFDILQPGLLEQLAQAPAEVGVCALALQGFGLPCSKLG